MPLILSLETSTPACSVALHRQGELVAITSFHVPNSTAAQLTVMINDILKITNALVADLDAVAISAGPGSYTGLRIGVATAKGLCYGLDIPLIAVNTLEHMAAQISTTGISGVLLCPMLDARRMEVYAMLLNQELDILEQTQARIIDDLSYQTWLASNRILFFGPGSGKCQSILRHPNARFIGGINPSAEKLGSLAFTRYSNNCFEGVADFEPFYLKDFIAKKPKSIV